MSNQELLKRTIEEIKKDLSADINSLNVAITLSKKVTPEPTYTIGALQDSLSCLNSAIAHLENAKSHLH